MDEKIQLKQLTKLQKQYLNRRLCFLCDQPLGRPGCGAIYRDITCSEDCRIRRRQQCLDLYNLGGKKCHITVKQKVQLQKVQFQKN